jgi:16S rRNA (uracil1498-N3)-methyltransferase
LRAERSENTIGPGAPLFLVDELPAGPVVRLDGPEGHHAAVVQRLRVGERILIGDGRGALAEATVVAVGKGTLDAECTARRAVPPPDPRITVVQALAKGERGELAVATMTEVGVDEIVPWPAARCVARWKDDKPLTRWRSTVREAVKQSRRAWRPAVAEPARTADVARRLGAAAAAYVLHEAADVRFSAVPLPAGGEIVLVVGPEGGIDAAEVAAFEAAGAVPVRMGEAVLRTSTAGAAAVAGLSVRLGRW